MQLMSIKIGLLSVLLIKTCVRKKGGLGGEAPQTLTRSYYFEPPLSKKRSRATVTHLLGLTSDHLYISWVNSKCIGIIQCGKSKEINSVYIIAP